MRGYLALLLGVSLPGIAQSTRLKPDEQIVFYPCVAQRVAGETNLWRTAIRGCVFESERRGLMLAALREALELKDIELTPEEERIFNARARWFLVDHERGKQIYIRVGGRIIPVGKSAADGRFERDVEIDDRNRFPRVHNGLPSGGKMADHILSSVQYEIVSSSDDTPLFAGEIFPLENEGLSVISDIDDTIKITEVGHRKAMLRNTFLREFEAVPGMAEFYQRLERSNHAAFHYISASPWQLYPALAAFVRTNGFPAGTFELKQFRWKDRSFFSLFADPEKYKPKVIEPLLQQFPKRQFILIGDSGERDPEAYGALARAFPEQIAHIYIRDVSGESTGALRYQIAFREVSRDKWQIFREPREIKCGDCNEPSHELDPVPVQIRSEEPAGEDPKP